MAGNFVLFSWESLMIRIRRRHAAPALVLLVAGAVAGAAFATSAPAKREPVTAKDYYAPGMTFEEIGKASVGQPGDAAPPCPEADTVAKLKEAKIPVGPCDPFPEDGQVRIVSDEKLEPAGPAPGVVCDVVNVHAAKGITGELCAAEAKILGAEAVQQGEKWCLQVTYVTGRVGEKTSEVVCEGDQPKFDGLRVEFASGG